MFTKPIHILLVEDSPSDVRLTQVALRQSTIPHHLHIAEDGEEALDFLYKRSRHLRAPRPDLVLLDLNLPNIDGREVLSTIKQDPHLCTIPVIVLSTSSAPTDVQESYKRAANCFITKPDDWERFTSVIQAIESFWFETATLPVD